MAAAGETVGVIGLGAMGLGTAQALLETGFDVVGYDVNPEAMNAFASAGGLAVTTPGEVASAARVIVILVVNARQVEAVLFGDDGIAASAAAGTVILQCATVSAVYIRDLEARLGERDIALLDTPVSGGTVKARSGDLTVMASGRPEHFEPAARVLDSMAATVYRLGDTAGPGSSMKLVNQLLAGVHIATAAEAMAFGIRAGIDPATIYEVITHSAGNSWMFENRMRHVLDADYTPSSAVDIFVKDLGIVTDSGRDLTFPLPMTSSALQLFMSASASGFGREDDSAVIKVFERSTGIKLPRAANDELRAGPGR